MTQRRKSKKTEAEPRRVNRRTFLAGPVLLPVWVRGCGCAEKCFPNGTKRKQKNILLRTLPCLQASGGPYG